jgi:Holliday junction resolvasome RuvABC DNA-binding subunit
MYSLGIKSVNDLKKIKMEDLVKINGVGKTIAQKIMLGISQKLKQNIDIEELTSVEREDTQYKSTIDTLRSLGVNQNSIEAIISKFKIEISELNEEDRLKFILKKLN